MPPFTPRATFPTIPSLPRSYFLGHHASALTKMKALLRTTDLVLECRDYRVPLTSRNPLFEDALKGTPRAIVYTKRDLGGNGYGELRGKEEGIIRGWYDGVGVETLFVRNGTRTGSGSGSLNLNSNSNSSSTGNNASFAAKKEVEKEAKKSISRVLGFLKQHARREWKLVGHRILVVGMPNVGKSTLLNALRAAGIGKGKVAATGAQPGVTRKVGSGVKIVASEDDTVVDSTTNAKAQNEGIGGGIYIIDTPGVFIPYVPDSSSMLKLALCGSVKDTILPPVVLADYLLYHINLVDPTLYSEYSAPTNDIVELLEAMGRKTGRLAKKGTADLEATALWMIQRWRTGFLGRFLLDDVRTDSLDERRQKEMDVVPSISQARKVEKERRRQRAREQYLKTK